MTTKNFILDIPKALHDIVQDFIVSALAVRPPSYVDYAVEFYLHLQEKGSGQGCENFRVRGGAESPEADSEEVCVDGEPVSDTVNIFQVSINPEAFQSPDLKHYPSEEDPNDGDSIVDLPSSDQAVPTDSEIKLSDTNITVLNRSLSNLKTENTFLQLNTSPITSPSHSFSANNPFTLSLHGNSFTIPSSSSLSVPLSNSVGILSIAPPHTSKLPTLPIHNSVPIPTNYPQNNANNRPSTPQNTTYFNSPANGFASHEVASPMSTPQTSPFPTPYKGSYNTQTSAAENLYTPPGNHQPHPNNYQCRSCNGVFKPHPRPLRQPFYSVPGTPEGSRPLFPSSQDTPDRTAVHALHHPSHFHQNDTIRNSSNGVYVGTPCTPNNKSDPSEKKFPCPICEKSYKSNTGLKRHLIVHTGERPYQCQYCFKSFYRKYVLTTHITRVHAKQIAATHS